MKYIFPLAALVLTLSSCSLPSEDLSLEPIPATKYTTNSKGIRLQQPESKELAELRAQRNYARQEVGSYFNTILFSGKRIPSQATVSKLNHSTEKAGPIKRTKLDGDVLVTYKWKYGILDLPLFGSLIDWDGGSTTTTVPFQTWIEE